MKYTDYDLRLCAGEEWLPSSEDTRMSWRKAMEKTLQDPNIRLPHYSDLIHAEEMARKKPELREKFGELQKGWPYWSANSENHDPNSMYACIVTEDHLHYKSHTQKYLGYMVRFIRQTNPKSVDKSHNNVTEV